MSDIPDSETGPEEERPWYFPQDNGGETSEHANAGNGLSSGEDNAVDAHHDITVGQEVMSDDMRRLLMAESHDTLGSAEEAEREIADAEIDASAGGMEEEEAEIADVMGEIEGERLEAERIAMEERVAREERETREGEARETREGEAREARGREEREREEEVAEERRRRDRERERIGRERRVSEGRIKSAINGYRRFRERDGIRQIDDAARGTAVAVPGAWFGNYMFNTAAAQSAYIATGSLSTTAFASPCWPAFLLGGRYAYAKYVNAPGVTREFVDAVHRCGGDLEKEQNNLASYLRMQDRKLINTDDEQLLLTGFHNAEASLPAETPYLDTNESYAKHCFAKLVELCERAADAHADGRVVPGLSEDETKALSKHHLSEDSLTVDERRERTEHLLQSSVAYGRLLANYHREKREAQVTGGTLGTAGVLSAVTLNLTPLIVGGLFYGGRKVYRWANGAGQHLEIGKDGELQGRNNSPILSPETTKVKGGSLYRPDYIDRYKEEGQLSDDEKRWLEKIQFPDSVLKRNYRTAKSLAHDVASHVQTILGHDVGFAMSVDEGERDLKKEAWKDEADRLKKYEDESDRLKGEIEAHKSDMLRHRSKTGGSGGGERAEERRVEARGMVEYLQSQIENKQKRVDRLDGVEAVEATAEADRIEGKKGLIVEQKDKVERARKKYEKVRKPKEPTKEMTAEAVGKNDEIAKAFAVKANQVFKAEYAEKAGAMGRFGHWTGEIAAAPAKAVGKYVGGAVGTAAIYGGAAAGISVLIPGVSTVIAPTTAGLAAGVLGVAKYILSSISPKK
jgi:hypothetical protein